VSSISGSDTDTDDEPSSSTQAMTQKSSQLMFKNQGMHFLAVLQQVSGYSCWILAIPAQQAVTCCTAEVLAPPGTRPLLVVFLICCHRHQHCSFSFLHAPLYLLTAAAWMPLDFLTTSTRTLLSSTTVCMQREKCLLSGDQS